MVNPFNKLFKRNVENNPVKSDLQKRIAKECVRISRLAIVGKLRVSHVNNLKRLYDDYYDKFPDVNAKAHADMQIKKLYGFAKV